MTKTVELAIKSQHNNNNKTCFILSVDYNTMYGQQYDNSPRMHETDSVRDSAGHDDVFR